MGLQSTPTFELQPAAQRQMQPTAYIDDFDFLNPYLPDYEQNIFARYGNQRLTGFMFKNGAEIPLDSDKAIWTEEGRLRVKYTNVTSGAAAGSNTATITINDTLDPSGAGTIALAIGMVGLITANDGTGQNAFLVTAVSDATADIKYYEAGGQDFAVAVACTIFITHSEYKKGTAASDGSLESYVEYFNNTPIIMKKDYVVNGSDATQIGWINVTDNSTGVSSNLWYLKSQADTRMRFDDELEMAALEAKPAAVGSGVIANNTGIAGEKGSEGIHYVVNTGGNVWATGYPVTLTDWQELTKRQDNQGAIAENLLWVNRAFSYAVDTMMSTLNSLGTGGTNWGAFANGKEMGLNLHFRDFTLGSYYFYKSDSKYYNDPTTRGNMPTAAGSGNINGLLVPAGSTNVYDENEGAKMARPFIHTRYRVSKTENRRYKVWATGSVAGVANSGDDVNKLNFLTERMTCTMGRNNFFIFNS